MNRRQKGSICFLWLILMLVLGMCFERIGADSFLEYGSSQPVQESATYEVILGSVEGVPLCGQTYLKDTYGTHEVSAVIRQGNRRWTDRSYRTGDGCLWLSVWVHTGLLNGGCQALHADRTVRGVYKHIMIVSYIHKKDGKKSDFLFYPI